MHVLLISPINPPFLLLIFIARLSIQIEGSVFCGKFVCDYFYIDVWIQTLSTNVTYFYTLWFCVQPASAYRILDLISVAKEQKVPA